MKRLLLLVGLLCPLVAFQEPDGTTTCNNFRSNAHKCACGRAMMCDRQHTPGSSGDPDEYKEGPNKCQMACRKDLCKCLSPCTTRSIK